MICGAADEGSAALFVCGGGEGRIWLRAPWHLPHRRARWHRRADDDVVGGGGLEEPRLFDRKSDDFPSQSLLTSGLDGRPSSSLHCLPRVHHPHAADANAPVCAAGATTPEPDPGLEDGRMGLGFARRANRREFVD